MIQIVRGHKLVEVERDLTRQNNVLFQEQNLKLASERDTARVEVESYKATCKERKTKQEA